MTDTENSRSQPADSRRADGGQDEPLERRIITHVAAQKNVNPTTLAPLYTVINPDALETLFAPQIDGTPRPGGQIQFDYSGYHITVTSEGDIQSTPLNQ